MGHMQSDNTYTQWEKQPEKEEYVSFERQVGNNSA